MQIQPLRQRRVGAACDSATPCKPLPLLGRSAAIHRKQATGHEACVV